MKKLLSAAVALALLATAGWVQAGELTGTWTLSINTPRGLQHPTLVVAKEGDEYSGVYNSLSGPIDIETIAFDGSAFSFPMTISIPIGDIEVRYIGTIEGDDMVGSAQSPRGAVPFTAVRDGS